MKTTILCFALSCVAFAQTRLATPVTILPKADRSAAGVLNFLDNTGANPISITESSPHILSLGSVGGLQWDDTNGVLGIHTTGGTTNGLVINSAAGSSSGFYLLDNGTYKWAVQKNQTSLDFSIFDVATSAFVMDIASGGTMKLEPATDVLLLPGSGEVKVTGNVLPVGTQSLGGTIAPWNSLYTSGIGDSTHLVTLGFFAGIFSGQVAPQVTNTGTVGTSSLYYANGYFTNMNLGITGLTQCVQANSAGLLSGTGSPCGTGSAGVSSLSPGTLTGAVTLAGGTGILVQHLSGSTITISPNTATTCSSAFTDCMTTDTSQNVTGSKTLFTGADLLANGTVNIGSSGNFFNNVYGNDFLVNSGGAITLENAGSPAAFIGFGSSSITFENSLHTVLFEMNVGGGNESFSNLFPSTNNAYTLGTPSLIWSTIYAAALGSVSSYVGTANILTITSALVEPSAANSGAVGTSGLPWGSGYIDNLTSTALTMAGNITASGNNLWNIGASGTNFASAYITNIFAGGIQTGTIEATSGYFAPGLVAGVTCAGAPTAAFATSVGIVTHC